MKKVLSVLLAVCMLMSMMTFIGTAATTADSDIYIETELSVEAPYAGVFAVTADQDVVLANETGHYVELLANEPANIVLLKGFNNLFVDIPATFTFTELEGQGLDQLDTVAHDGFDNLLTTQTMHHYDASIGPGGTYTYNVNIPESGMYYLNTQISSAVSNAKIIFEYETGMSSVAVHYQWGWCLNGDDGDMEWVYLRAGEQTVTATNTADHWITINDFRISDTKGLVGNALLDGIRFDADRFVVAQEAPAPTDAPDNDYPEYITYESVNLSGAPLVAALLNNDDGTGAAAQADGSVWVSAGYSGNFNINVAEEGMYYVQLKTDKNTSAKVIVNDQYQQELNLTGWAFGRDSVWGGLAYIYLNEGDNTVKFAPASGCLLYNLEIKASVLALENLAQEFDLDDLVAYNPNYTDIIIGGYNDLVPEKSEGTLNQYATNNGVEVVGGSVAGYVVNVNEDGFYKVETVIGGTMIEPYPTIYVDVNDTYRAEFATSFAGDWGEDINTGVVQTRSTDAEGNIQYLYLTAGENVITVSASHSHFLLWKITFKTLSPAELEEITLDDVKLAPPKPLKIYPYSDSILTTNRVDYNIIHTADGKPTLNPVSGTELLPWEWQRFEVTAKTAGVYKVSVNTAVYNGDVQLSFETENSIATINTTKNSGDWGGNYQNFSGDSYLTLKEGVNSIWVRNDGVGFVYLPAITLTYVEDTAEIPTRVFVQAHKFDGAAESPMDIPAYTVRNGYYGIHVGSSNNIGIDTEVKTYTVNIPRDDYYGLVMAGTVPLTATMNVTLDNGVDAPVVIFDGLTPYFGNHNQDNSVTLTEEKVYLPAGEYTMTVTYTENKDVGSDNEMLTHIHGFELTTLTRQDLLLAAMQSAESTADIEKILDNYADVLRADIGADVENDFVYPEYAYSALLNCAMLESGAYETYQDVLDAYDFAKNMISVAASDDGMGLTYTVQVGDWNDVGTAVYVVVYEGDEAGNITKLYQVAEGYLEYEEPTYTYQPVYVTLEGYEPYQTDIIKVFVWSADGELKPVF